LRLLFPGEARFRRRRAPDHCVKRAASKLAHAKAVASYRSPDVALALPRLHRSLESDGRKMKGWDYKVRRKTGRKRIEEGT
jgi:hypothetical protein